VATDPPLLHPDYRPTRLRAPRRPFVPVSEALACTGGAAAAAREMLGGLDVRPERMRANLAPADPAAHVAAASQLVDRMLERYRRCQ
jgi:Asp-tRNA(Asn)/Glu-tRNA(Gln) amidotransferase A subunit family amidase